MSDTAQRIREAALSRFAAKGFTATTLSEIAQAVGIKKPSIYAHFPGKQELYLDLVSQVVEQELAHARTIILSLRPAVETLWLYLEDTQARFNNTPGPGFWLRAVYLPPPGLVSQISNHADAYTDTMRGLVTQALEHNNPDPAPGRLSTPMLVSAYMGILRGLHAELMHGKRGDMQATLSALWLMYVRALGPGG